ncbi:hypothetical protein AAMO2058_000686900 [Amorphochlora amoebiformis]
MNNGVAESLLIASAIKGELKGVKAALRQGAQAEFKGGWRNGTALTHASRFGHTEVVECLVTEAKAKLNAKNYDGHTSLILAARFNRVPVVKILLDAKANPSLRGGCQNKSALDWAKERGYHNIIRLLRQYIPRHNRSASYDLTTQGALRAHKPTSALRTPTAMPRPTANSAHGFALSPKHATTLPRERKRDMHALSKSTPLFSSKRAVFSSASRATSSAQRSNGDSHAGSPKLISIPARTTSNKFPVKSKGGSRNSALLKNFIKKILGDTRMEENTITSISNQPILAEEYRASLLIQQDIEDNLKKAEKHEKEAKELMVKAKEARSNAERYIQERKKRETVTKSLILQIQNRYSGTRSGGCGLILSMPGTRAMASTEDAKNSREKGFVLGDLQPCVKAFQATGVEVVNCMTDAEMEKSLVVRKISRFFSYGQKSGFDTFFLVWSGQGQRHSGNMCFHNKQYLSFDELIELWVPVQSASSRALLVLVMDSCHSGCWINRLKELKQMFNITIQAATLANETSVDGVFLPIWAKIQLREMSLRQARDFFENRNANGKHQNCKNQTPNYTSRFGGSSIKIKRKKGMIFDEVNLFSFNKPQA